MAEKKKKIVYISGPMRGLDEQESRDAFNQAYAKLEAEGYAPVDPWDLHDTLPMFSDDEMLEIDLAIVKLCDAIYMLDGWKMSKGANAEMCEFACRHGAYNTDGVIYEPED